MKYFCICVIVMEIFKNVYGGNTNLDDPPRQKTCHNLQAVRRTLDNETKFFKHINAKGKSSMLWKLTKMDDYYHQFGDKHNYCSMFHFGPDCKATRQNMQIVIDGVEMLPFFAALSKGEKEGQDYFRSRTYAVASWLIYNEKTNDVLRTRCKIEDQDENYFIHKYSLDRMDLLKQDKSGALKEVPRQNIPEFVKSSFRDFAVIAVAPHMNWCITRTCDLKTTWIDVLIDSKVPLSDQQEILDGYKKEINEKLVEFGIDSTTLTDFLPLELPLKIPIPPTIEEVGVSEPWLPDAIKESIDLNGRVPFTS